MYDLFKKVYECHDIEDAEYTDMELSTGLPVDYVLKTVKWLFIEQDSRYWNYSGRNMLWGLVPDKE